MRIWARSKPGSYKCKLQKRKDWIRYMLFPFSLSYSQFQLVSILYPGMHLSHTEVDRAFMRITSFHKEI